MNIIHDIAWGLDYLHSKGLMHRDIKPQNILISKNRRMKLCDLEVIKELNDPDQTKRVGTNGYIAPEFNEHSQKYTEKIDIWSLGISILQLYSKKKISEVNDSKDEILQKIKEKDENLFNLLDLCLKKKPEERISSEQIISFIEKIWLDNPSKENKYVANSLKSNDKTRLFSGKNTDKLTLFRVL